MTDQEDPKPAVQRPLSPHLQIYKPQLTSATSIFHRVTGAALAVSLFIVTWALMAIAMGPDHFSTFKEFFSSIFGRLILFGWTLAFFYHFCSGIRHLIMDTGAMMTIEKAYKSFYITYAMTLILTIGTWGLYYYCRGYTGV
jgi:succinate dehydrogenase / fumarate reductase cytochrome b subunit